MRLNASFLYWYVLKYIIYSGALFGSALISIIYYYSKLNEWGVHGVAIVFLLFLFMFLLGVTLSLAETRKEKRPAFYFRSLRFILAGNIVFFGSIWALRKLVFIFTIRYLPPEWEELAEIIFIGAFLAMVYLVIHYHAVIKKKFPGFTGQHLVDNN